MSKNLYEAGAVRRWHTNPAMAHVHDTVEAHSGRVARWLARWHPAPSAALLRAALAHDDGEHSTGDIPTTAKTLMPIKVRAWLDEKEAKARAEVWAGTDPLDGLSESDTDWLHLADRVDAYHMVRQHAPAELEAPEWQNAAQWAREECIYLGIPDVTAAMGG